jgi:hypothetical protein
MIKNMKFRMINKGINKGKNVEGQKTEGDTYEE